MRKPVFQFIAGDALGFSIAGTGAVGGKPPNVPTARAIGIDVDPIAIRRIIGTIVVDRARSQLLFSAAAYCDTKDIEVTAVPLADKGEPLAVWRPAVKIAGVT